MCVKFAEYSGTRRRYLLTIRDVCAARPQPSASTRGCSATLAVPGFAEPGAPPLRQPPHRVDTYRMYILHGSGKLSEIRFRSGQSQQPLSRRVIHRPRPNPAANSSPLFNYNNHRIIVIPIIWTPSRFRRIYVIMLQTLRWRSGRSIRRFFFHFLFCCKEIEGKLGGWSPDEKGSGSVYSREAYRCRCVPRVEWMCSSTCCKLTVDKLTDVAANLEDNLVINLRKFP